MHTAMLFAILALMAFMSVLYAPVEPGPRQMQLECIKQKGSWEPDQKGVYTCRFRSTNPA